MAHPRGGASAFFATPTAQWWVCQHRAHPHPAPVAALGRAQAAAKKEPPKEDRPGRPAHRRVKCHARAHRELLVRPQHTGNPARQRPAPKKRVHPRPGNGHKHPPPQAAAHKNAPRPPASKRHRAPNKPADSHQVIAPLDAPLVFCTPVPLASLCSVSLFSYVSVSSCPLCATI